MVRAALSTPTFSQDVAPIVFERCTPCHRPGQGTPFTLLIGFLVLGEVPSVAQIAGFAIVMCGFWLTQRR